LLDPTLGAVILRRRWGTRGMVCGTGVSSSTMSGYAGGMNVVGLPVRVAYASAVLVLSGVATFYGCMHWLPELTATYPALDPGGEGYGIFKSAICMAAGIALTLSLPVLTLPGVRRRKRRGRSTRIAFTAVVVVVASVLTADQGFRLRYDLLFAAWLAYLMAFTFVRYGVVDEVRRSSAPTNEY
jgi:hypothetical protein